MENSPVTVEAIYEAPVTVVWQALTDNSEMRKWYFKLDEFKPEVGFRFQFEGGSENETFTHLCEITEIIPENKISYTWKYQGYPGSSEVTFQLIPQGDKTRIVLTHEGLETFPSSPAFAKENFREGWKMIIGTNLKNFVEKKS
jgi:uncharacterized protein YndB with AHSA1/START domain